MPNGWPPRSRKGRGDHQGKRRGEGRRGKGNQRRGEAELVAEGLGTGRGSGAGGRRTATAGVDYPDDDVISEPQWRTRRWMGSDDIHRSGSGSPGDRRRMGSDVIQCRGCPGDGRRMGSDGSRRGGGGWGAMTSAEAGAEAIEDGESGGMGTRPGRGGTGSTPSIHRAGSATNLPHADQEEKRPGDQGRCGLRSRCGMRRRTQEQPGGPLTDGSLRHSSG